MKKGSHTGKPGPMRGRHHTEKTIRLMREAHKGKHHSEEHKKKNSEAHKGKNNSRYGKPGSMKDKNHTEETKQKLRQHRLLQTFSMIDTSIELKVKKQLENNNIDFIHPWNLEPYYQCDFYIPNMNLIIECDGDYWHSLPKMIHRDRTKDSYAKNRGYNMLRLPEHVINKKEFDILEILKSIGQHQIL